MYKFNLAQREQVKNLTCYRVSNLSFGVALGTDYKARLSPAVVMQITRAIRRYCETKDTQTFIVKLQQIKELYF